jgi:UDP-3-O-[3-hydroxymyristoyl] glucosamine N-acyltransferase
VSVPITLKRIAASVNARLDGDGEILIDRVAGLRDAGPGAVTFLANPRYEELLRETRASAVIVADAWHGECAAAVLRVPNPDRAFAEVAGLFAPAAPVPTPGIHATAVIAEDAVLGDGVSVGPHCVVESGARIGPACVLGAGCYIGHGCVTGTGCRLYPHVSIREYVTLGDRVIIHNGAVIGSDGFGYTHEDGAWRKIPQVGTVSIGNDVEIGANVTIDRARFGRTVISDGVKIDNLVQVAHNVVVGPHTAMASQVGISGSTHIGRGVQLGGQAGLAGHLVVGDGAVVGAQAGVTKDVDPGSYVSGYPAMPHVKAAKLHAHTMRLPQLKQRVADVEKRLNRIEAAEQKGKTEA